MADGWSANQAANEHEWFLKFVASEIRLIVEAFKVENCDDDSSLPEV